MKLADVPFEDMNISADEAMILYDSWRRLKLRQQFGGGMAAGTWSADSQKMNNF